MKRILTAIALLALVVAMRLPAPAVEPGSKDDPIITRSYLETLHAWQITNLQEGQTVSLDLGVEFVVRSGKLAVVGVGTQGLIDLTAGQELKDGQPIPPCHLILSPASDRRGIRANSQVVMLTRGYTH